MKLNTMLKKLSYTIYLMLLVLGIAFSVEGKISNLDSQDTSDITDDDEIYHAGQLIKIIATDSENRVGLEGTISIISKDAGYSSGPAQNLVDENNGSYTFLWDTTNLRAASDYLVTVVLDASLRSLTITIDNSPPTDPRIVINKGEPFTANASVRLNLSASEATEMYISGDVIDDANTFQWIPYAESIMASLTAGYKTKTVQVQFRDEARNLSQTATARINYEAALIFSEDADDPTDDDEIYHSGQLIKLTVTETQGRSELDGTIQIKSQAAGYDSGVQKLDDIGNGIYTYLWNTSGLPEASDYTVNATITSVTDVVITPQPLVITIDNDPPTDVSILIDGDEPVTSLLSISLTLSAQDAAEMFIEGDIVDDTNTFEWIPYSPSLTVNLTEQDGEKEVSAKFRDAALNESVPQTANITLDRAAPKAGQIVIEEGQTHIDYRLVTLTLSAKNAVEMYLEGDIVNDADTFQWIAFASQKQVMLTQGDGEKRISVKFRNFAQIESEPVEANIILDLEPPIINRFESQAANNPEDDDNYYHAGQAIIFRITTKGNESGFSGNIRIKSVKSKYDSGPQTLTDEEDGSYSYTWDTTALNESLDYTVEATLVDALEHEATTKMTLIIDNTPPRGKITVEDNALRTISRSVTLKIEANDALEMYLSGDIVDDTNTFEWVPYADEIILNLTEGSGNKVVNAKFKDKADNESKEVEATIILITTPPQIIRVDSWDESETSDNDEYYHAGQSIKIVIWGPEDEPWFLGTVRIRSSDGSYDFESPDMFPSVTDGFALPFAESNSRYTYLWDTTNLKEGKYAVEAVLSDGIANEVTDNSLSITIDNTPPFANWQVASGKSKVREDGQLVVASTSVNLSLQDDVGDAKEIYIDGDVIDDTNTFEWIFLVETLTINLTAEDGEKQISIKVRDAAENESDAAVKTIILDTTGPSGSILINDGAGYTANPLVSIEIDATDAAEIYLSGDIQTTDNTFQWKPYASPVEVYLTEDDGIKTVKVTFKDDLGNIGEEIEDTITLDATPPKIKSVNSQNIADSEDDDDRYHVGDSIKIMPEITDEASELKGSIRITSETAGYDSGSQKLTADDEGILSFLWETKGFREAEDYKVEIELEDAAGNETVDTSLILALVSPSVQESVRISNGDEYTESDKIELQIFSDSAAEMFIAGDVKDDSSTFEWIDYSSALTVKLTPGDGEKTVTATFRDKLQRESGTVEDTIILDTEAPQILAVKSHDVDDDKDDDNRYHAGETVEFIVTAAAAETGLEGTIRIRSNKVNYDSGLQKLRSVGTQSPTEEEHPDEDEEYAAGEYRYLWETIGLKEADDYIVEVALEDLAAHKTIDSALVITIDNTPPRHLEFITKNAKETRKSREENLLTQTKTRSITLQISAEDAVMMWVEGDVVDDTNTFEWIPYTPELVVNLTSGDGEKVIKVRHRDKADNESQFAETTIFLNESPPVIQSVDSADKDNPADADEIYHAGQQIVITIKSAEAETGLEAMVQIRSVGAQSPTHSVGAQSPTEENGYDSGLERAIPNPEDEGSYSYLWDTSGLKSASDYAVKVTLQDSLGQQATDESLIITIDNEPPTLGKLTINNGEQFTNEARVLCEFSSVGSQSPTDESFGSQSPTDEEESLEMFIAGDIVEDDATFKWVPLLETKEVQLTEGDGEKTVRVKFRDEALNESPAVEASITLDTTAPTNARIVINSGEAETDSRSITLNLLAEDATEMYIDGDVTESDNTFRWIPYKASKQVELTAGDGKKQVGVKYRDDVDNESARVEVSIILDQPGPTSPSIVIKPRAETIASGLPSNEAKGTHTSSPTINLSLSAEDATEMYIDGDIVVGSVTFQWIPYQSELQVNLIKSDGKKQVRARFRNGPGNESEQVEISIILDQTAPVIATVTSYDVINSSDDDGIYHSGQLVVLQATAEKNEISLNGSVRITSDKVKYDSGAQKLTDRGDGSYTYNWQTDNLQDAKDYIVEISLKDAVEHNTVDNSLVVTIDNLPPVKYNVIMEDEEKTLFSRSVTLNLEAEDAMEMFIEGNIIDDTNTFQWIPFAPEIVVNLAGNDGEKNIIVKFRDAAGNESDTETIEVILELNKPRLLANSYLIQPEGLEILYLVLPFDEAIEYVSEADFHVNLSNPDRLEDKLDLNAIEFVSDANKLNIPTLAGELRPKREVEAVVDENKVVIQLTEELVHILRSWTVEDYSTSEPVPTKTGRIPDEIWVQIPENSVFDVVGNGNLGSEGKPSVARLTRPNFLQQAIAVPREFSPNGDGVKDEVTILYSLRSESDVTVKIEDWRQRSIYKWEQAAQLKDIPYQLSWDGKKEDGSDYPDGMYTISIRNADPLTGVLVITETFNIILDNTPPEITKTEPLPNGRISPISAISVEAIDISDNQAASGIDEGNVYVILDNDPEQLFPLIESPDIENRYTMPSGQFILPSGKHIITFHVADKAGNSAEVTAEYTIVATGESPILYLMNYPNPFKPGDSTTIRYVLIDYVESAVMSIYDASGNLVFLEHMAGDELAPGEHRFSWNGTDLFGERLARGVYFCEFRVVSKNSENPKSKELHKIAVW